MPHAEEFLREHREPICADCIATLLPISELRVLLQLDRLGGDGTIRLVVGRCPRCHQTLPTYRFAA
jgi:RNase P subunit RPR2